MKLKRDSASLWGLSFGLLLLGVVGFLSDRRTQGLVDSHIWVAHTLEVIADLRQIKSDLIGAENAWRGYALFYKESDLAQTREFIARVSPELRRVRQATIDNVRQQQRLDLLEPQVARRMALLQQAISVASVKPVSGAELGLAYERLKTGGEGPHQILEEMENEEQSLLVNRQQRADREKTIATIMIGGGFLIAFLFVAGAGGLGQWEIVRRHKIEVVLQNAHNNIATNLQDAQQRGNEQSILSELAERLQSCRNLTEGLPFIARSMEQLFSGESGSLFLTSASRNILESAVSWGPKVASVASFVPDDCWALRRGRLQNVNVADEVLRCSHLDANAEGDAICLPLVAQGETLGVMCLYCCTEKPQGVIAASASPLQNRIRIATVAGAQISLAVANLQLRETLRNQSIRDSLTGLFNRRYLEESLARELHRSIRRKSPLAVMMIDIDHFKRFNDTYGHELGDRLLSAFGNFLSASIRGEDIACRYGGEEFTLMLPDAAAEGATKRAESLRLRVQEISVPLKDGGTSKITISIGLAVFPEHGETPEALLRAADAALYQAKSAGRDRLMNAPLRGRTELLGVR